MLGKAVSFLRTRKWVISVMTIFFTFLALGVFSPNTCAIDPPLPPNTPDTSQEADVIIEETTETPTKQPAESEVTETCMSQSGAVGWLVCPGASWVADGVDNIYSAIRSFLELKPIISDANSPIYLVWSYIRDIANIVFVIVFLIAIISQISGIGISNYNIKKMLPKLVIGAILINLSFLLCAIAVDISNILGYSLTGAFEGIQTDLIMRGAASTAANVNPGEYIGALIVGGGAAGLGIASIGGLGALLWVAIPLVFAFLIAVLAAFLTLVARQAAVIILVMIAPLAMAAFILPNTEKWFDKWKSLGLKMLILFPMLSLLIGATKLAGWAIVASSDSALTVLLGFAVQIIPLFMAPSMFKMSGTILSKVNDFARKPFGGMRNSVGKYADSRKLDAKQRNMNRPWSPSGGLNRFLEKRSALSKANSSALQDINKAKVDAYLASKGIPRSSRFQSRYYRNTTKAQLAKKRAELAQLDAETSSHDWLAGEGKYAGIKKSTSMKNLASQLEAVEGEVLDRKTLKEAHDEMRKTAIAERLAKTGQIDPNTVIGGVMLSQRINSSKSRKKHIKVAAETLYDEYRPSSEELAKTIPDFIDGTTDSYYFRDKGEKNPDGTAVIRREVTFKDKPEYEVIVEHYFADYAEPKRIINIIGSWGERNRPDMLGKSTKYFKENKISQAAPFFNDAFMEKLSSENSFKNTDEVYYFIANKGISGIESADWAQQGIGSLEVLIDLMSGKNDESLLSAGMDEAGIKKLRKLNFGLLRQIDRNMTPDQKKSKLSPEKRDKLKELFALDKSHKNPYSES